MSIEPGADDAAPTPTPPVPESGGQAWARLLRMARPRFTKANFLALILAAILGFAIVTQVQQTRGQQLQTLGEDQLVRILDDVTQDGVRLGTEIRDLEHSRDQLAGGATNEAAALDAARNRVNTLGILAGTVPATGPGVRITITDPEHKIGGIQLLDTLEELRDAGAEAVQIGDARVIASTWFTDTDTGVSVSGQIVTAPYTILAIGDSTTMASAMGIPGGVVDSMHSLGGDTTIDQLSTVQITALRGLSSPRYAQPVETPTATPSK